MPKNLTHDEYVDHQFRKDGLGLRTTYRNVILHASLIEGVLKRNTNKKTFEKAIDGLPTAIDQPERTALHELRKARNELVHDCFKDRYDQNEIEDLLKKVMQKVLKVYRISEYLDKELFKKRKIDRLRKIAYQGPTTEEARNLASLSRCGYDSQP